MMTAKMLKKLSLISGARSVGEKLGTRLLVEKLLLKTKSVETRLLKMGVSEGREKERKTQESV